jgi:hypothetical protein
MELAISVVPANEASFAELQAIFGARGDPAAERTSGLVAYLDGDHVGTEGVFAAAGFAEVSRPTVRRAVMRIDF